MNGDFEAALSITLGLEGGYSNVEGDRGGATNFGITQGILDVYRRGAPTDYAMPVTVAALTADAASRVYRAIFWDPIGGDTLPTTLAILLFDATVHHGPSNAISMLQAALWVPQDGALGPVTLRAVGLMPLGLPYAFLTIRRDFCRRLAAADPTQAKFLAGWYNRISLLRARLKIS